MRNIDTIFMHYTATYDDDDIGRDEIDQMHKANGWNGIGYHFVIRLDGTVEKGRPVEQVGAHVKGHNEDSLGIVLVGGLRRETGPDIGVDTRTPEQKASAKMLVSKIMEFFPIKEVRGHMDVAATQCPAYDAGAWWQSVQNDIPEPEPLPPAPDKPVSDIAVLNRGDKGLVILNLQAALTGLGYDVKWMDGIFGSRTETAVRSFQKDQGLPVTGEFHTQEWLALVRTGVLKRIWLVEGPEG